MASDSFWETVNEVDTRLLLAFKGVLFLDGKAVSPSRKDSVWPRDGIMHATCPYQHQPPYEMCSCGIYATTSLSILSGYVHNYGNKLSPVLLASACGDTEVWSSGWRAQAAQAHYIVDNTRGVTGFERRNRYLAIDVAQEYFELPVINISVAATMIELTWKEQGYTRLLPMNSDSPLAGYFLEFDKERVYEEVRNKWLE